MKNVITALIPLPDDGKLVLTVLDKGIYELVLENNRKVPEIKALDGAIDWVIDVDYTILRR